MSPLADTDGGAAPTVVVNYGMGNLRSVVNAFAAVGREVTVSADPADLDDAAGVVLPGVGAFGDGMTNLRDGGWLEPLTAAAARGVPLLGICLGMQLLAATSDEHGLHQGLGWIPGHVRRLRSTDPSIRIPHIGWNDVDVVSATPLLESRGAQPSFYFVHSFALDADAPGVSAVCDHGMPFAAAVQRDNVFGVQFHPEKSHVAGLQLLRNFCALTPT